MDTDMLIAICKKYLCSACIYKKKCKDNGDKSEFTVKQLVSKFQLLKFFTT